MILKGPKQEERGMKVASHGSAPKQEGGGMKVALRGNRTLLNRRGDGMGVVLRRSSELFSRGEV